MYRPKINIVRLITHVILMIFGWGMYICGLIWSYQFPEPIYTTVIFIVIIEVFILVIGIISWIIHHLKIHKKLGPRTTITPAIWNYDEDWLGYKVDGNFEQLKKSQVVTITCSKETYTKYFSGTPK